MTKHSLTSGLNGCIIKSEETEAALSFLERLEYPVLFTPSVCQYLLDAVSGGEEEDFVSPAS